MSESKKVAGVKRKRKSPQELHQSSQKTLDEHSRIRQATLTQALKNALIRVDKIFVKASARATQNGEFSVAIIPSALDSFFRECDMHSGNATWGSCYGTDEGRKLWDKLFEALRADEYFSQFEVEMNFDKIWISW